MTHFDFKEWADLYQVDPEAFELRREAALAEYVASVEESRRKPLEHTLFRIRMTRERAKSPLQAAMEASNLMWESFGKLREEVATLEAALTPAPLKSNGLRLVNPLDETHADQGEQARPDAQTDAEPGAERPDASAKVIRFKASGKHAH